MKYEVLWNLRTVVEIRLSSAYIARDSLNNNRDQWSDLSIILQFLNIGSVKLVLIGLVESGENCIRV